MTERSSAVNAEPPTSDDFLLLRDVEVRWLAGELSASIANLGYPVGMGIAPQPDQMERAAAKLFERYAKMIEMAHGRHAQGSLHPEDRTIFVLQEIARGRCDNGRPLSGETARQMARAALDNWPGRTSTVPSTDDKAAAEMLASSGKGD